LLFSETEHVFTDFLAYAVRELWLDKGFRAYILARAADKGMPEVALELKRV